MSEAQFDNVEIPSSSEISPQIVKTSTTKSVRGFAKMDPAKQREIAKRGGIAAHRTGHAHKFSSEEAREAGRKGGRAVSANRAHMAEIGRKGGVAKKKRVVS